MQTIGLMRLPSPEGEQFESSSRPNVLQLQPVPDLHQRPGQHLHHRWGMRWPREFRGREFRGHNTKLSPLRFRGGVGWGLAYRSASLGRRDPTPLRLGSRAAKSHCPSPEPKASVAQRDGKRIFTSTPIFRHPELVSGPIFRHTRSLVFGRNPYSLRLFGQLRACGMMGPETSSG